MKINRKKEVKSKNRNKWIIGGIVAFAGIGLIGSGFATWVIGTTSAQKDGSVTVNVDDAQVQNVDLAFELSDNALSLTEPNTSNDENFVRVNDGAATDLTFAFSTLKITYQESIELRVTIDLNAESKAIVATDELGITGRGTKYIDFTAYETTVTLGAGTGEGGANVYEVDIATEVNQHCTFEWGDFFNGQKPSDYYNAYFNANPDLKTSENGTAVVAELTAMKNAYSTNGITFTITVEPVHGA